MDRTAADEFVNWFRSNSARLATIHDEMLNVLGTDKSCTQQVMKLFQKLEKEIAPRLTKVEDGLLFEVGPGKTKKHAMILSAGGVPELIPAVKHLSSALSDVSEWDVIAFKPVRAIDDSVLQIVMTSDGEMRVAPSDVFVSLHPQLTKVGARLYFNGYKADDYQAWGHVGFNFLDFCLGEYVVMESVGEISFHSRDDAPKEAFSVSSLKSKFDEAVSTVRSRFTELSQMNQTRRLEQALALISGDVDKLNESITASSDNELSINVIFWADNSESEDVLKKVFSNFDVSLTPRLTSAGTGYEVVMSGVVQRKGFLLHEWLMQRLSEVKEFVLLTAVYEPAPVNPMIAQFVAASLIENKRFDEAIGILKSALRGVGGQDDWQLHGLLGMAYLEAGKNQEAVATYEQALILAEDNEVRGEILTNKGSALQRSGNLDDAIICFEQALKLDEEKYTRQYNLGQALAQKGRVDEACVHLSNALKAKPDLKEYMLNDTDLKQIRDSEQFKAMIEASSKSGFLSGLFKRGKK
jgi:tetratricopeptide (TPR) repeat protein